MSCLHRKPMAGFMVKTELAVHMPSHFQYVDGNLSPSVTSAPCNEFALFNDKILHNM